MMTTIPGIATPRRATPRMEHADLRNFFDRLATGDYHALAKELDIPKPITPSPPSTPGPVLPEFVGADGEISLDSFDSLTFEPTVEGLERAVSLLHGPSSPTRQTAEQEEAFQFTFRLMIHKLYTIRDFKTMVDDVVRVSQERFQRLPPELTSAASSRRASFASSYLARDGDGDADSLASIPSFASPSEGTLPSSPSLRSVDRLSDLNDPAEPWAGARVVKKRCVGRRMSLAEPGAGGDDDKAGGPGWVYDSAVASVEPAFEPPSYASFVSGLPPMSPAAESPSRYGYCGSSDDGDGSSRKRRFSLLAARGF
ncbi:hypothetical protein C8Q77DRAFT_1200211 [Trametes polyzona]|nr:hypothetical protein C8Q77DRAFT_1200211 [Trametes polyzona]